MINFDHTGRKYIREHNPNWPQIPDNPYRILIIGDSESEKINLLDNVISHRPDIDKFCLYAMDSCEAKYQLLIHKGEGIGLKYYNDSKTFIEYSNNMHGIHENIKECNLNKERKILIVFHDMIADMLSNKKYNPTVTKVQN